MLRLCSRFVCLFAAATLAALPVLADTGRVAGRVRVIDGDTLQVAGRRIRLHGIDAPERDQPCTTAQGVPFLCGRWVSDEVQARFGGRRVECDVLEQDR